MKLASLRWLAMRSAHSSRFECYKPSLFDRTATKNAVAGNTGGTAFFSGDGAYNSATDFVLGHYGVDTVNNTVWAVVNHNSDFGVSGVPEPSRALLLVQGLACAVLRRRRGAVI